MNWLMMYLVFLALIDDIAFSGARLRLINHPVFIRARWMSIGVLIASMIKGFIWWPSDVWTWIFLAILAASFAKTKSNRRLFKIGGGTGDHDE